MQNNLKLVRITNQGDIDNIKDFENVQLFFHCIAHAEFNIPEVSNVYIYGAGTGTININKHTIAYVDYQPVDIFSDHKVESPSDLTIQMHDSAVLNVRNVVSGSENNISVSGFNDSLILVVCRGVDINLYDQSCCASINNKNAIRATSHSSLMVNGCERVYMYDSAEVYSYESIVYINNNNMQGYSTNHIMVFAENSIVYVIEKIKGSIHAFGSTNVVMKLKNKSETEDVSLILFELSKVFSTCNLANVVIKHPSAQLIENGKVRLLPTSSECRLNQLHFTFIDSFAYDYTKRKMVLKTSDKSSITFIITTDNTSDGKIPIYTFMDINNPTIVLGRERPLTRDALRHVEIKSLRESNFSISDSLMHRGKLSVKTENIIDSDKYPPTKSSVLNAILDFNSGKRWG